MVIDRPADRRLALSSARVDFLERGTNPELHGVPEVVAASWRRSVSHGVHPDGLNGGYSDAFDPASRLARLARPPVVQQPPDELDVALVVAAPRADRTRQDLGGRHITMLARTMNRVGRRAVSPARGARPGRRWRASGFDAARRSAVPDPLLRRAPAGGRVRPGAVRENGGSS